MQFRLRSLVLMLAVACGYSAPASAADNPLAKPILMVQIASGEEILNRAEYLINTVLADRENQKEAAKQALGTVRALAGDDGKDGIGGIDIKKPIVFYAGIATDQSMPFAVMIPVTDPETVLKELKTRLGIEPTKDADGLYTIVPPIGGQELYARFANGYAYVSAQSKANVAAAILPKPDGIVTRDPSFLSLSLKLDNIPKMFRDLAMGQFEMQMAKEKQKEDPNAPPALRALKPALIDGVSGVFKQFLYETDAVRVKLDADPKTDELSFAFELVPLKGSPMAAYAKGLKDKATVAGSALDPKSPMAFHVNALLPEMLKAPLSAMIDQAMEEGIAKSDPAARGEVEKLFKALEPTLKSGIIDFAAGATVVNGKLNLAVGIQTVKGAEVEKAVKSIAAAAPPEVQNFLNLDADKSAGANLHELKVGPLLDANAQRILGESNAWFAVRDDLLVASIGPDAKKAVMAGIASKAGKSGPMKLSIGVKGLAPLMETEPERAAATKFAREIFDKVPGSDTVSLGFEGGESLKLKFAMKGTLIRFFAKMDAAKKGD